jgi:putative ABC transport system permease protein
LASRLKAKKGDNVSIVAQTVDGVVNAADVTVRAVFSTTIAEIDNQVAYIPIKLAQKILDTDKVENWIVRLNSMETAERFKLALAPKLEAKDSTLTIKAWRELSSLYNQVEEFYDIQNLIIQIILSVLTILAITNTVGMTVFERTGEIGTLRALGATQSEIIQQFMIEGFVLACLAAVIGSILGSIFILGLNSANVMVNMPGSSMPVQITASYEVSAFALAILCGLISTLIGTFIPAWRASRLVVVEALRRNL